MHVEQFAAWSDAESIVPQWDAWTRENPMLSPAWLRSWWEAMVSGNPHHELCLATVRVGRQVIGLAPCYRSKSLKHGSCIRFLGDGRACSDHQTLVCPAENRSQVATAIARWLNSADTKWDSLVFNAIDQGDPTMQLLLQAMKQLGYDGRCVPTNRSWYVPLPATWEEYLGGLSKNHRKRCRRWYRQLVETGRVSRYICRSVGEIDALFSVLRELHNSRRNMLGQAGIFEHARLADHLESAFAQLYRQGRAQLLVTEIDKQPAGAEYLLLGSDRVLAYQSGFNPRYRDIGAGNISLLMTIRWAIENGYGIFDFLRGDESYKSSWGALPCPAHDLVVLRGNLPGLIRQTLYDSKAWLQSLAAST